MSRVWLTPEQLSIRTKRNNDGTITVEEVGKNDYVVHTYVSREPEIWDDPSQLEDRGGPEDLFRSIKDLEKRCAELRSSNAELHALAPWIWNRKKAKARFRRWVLEKSRFVLTVPDAELRQVARTVIDAAPEPEATSDLYKISDLFKIIDQIGVQSALQYKQNRVKTPVLLTSVPLTGNLEWMLGEACEAYWHGLSLAVAALCRATLEALLKEVWQHHKDEFAAIPYDPESLGALLNCVPAKYLGEAEKGWANQIKQAGDTAVHEGKSADAWNLLRCLVGVAENITDRGGLTRT